MNRVVFHIDVNSAYLSWEAVYRLMHLGGNLDLREVCSAVGGDAAMRQGIILAKSIPAQRYGIKTGEAVWEARRKCPGLLVVPPNYDLYQRCSKSLMEILRDYSPEVEQYSIDEAFVDMTETMGLFQSPVDAAESIRKKVWEELGFTVNVGVSSNKLLAKMASDFKKPDMVHTLFPWEIERKMWPLPVSSLFFVGRETAGKLFGLGIKTIGQLAQTEPEILKKHLKKHGEVIWAFANGIDMAAVERIPPPNKGYGNSTTIPFDVTDCETAKRVLLALAETLAARLRKDRVKAEIVAVGIKDTQFHHMSHQKILKTATDITVEIHNAAYELFLEAWDKRPVRHLGIHTGRIRNHSYGRQLSLFDETDYEKLEKLDRAVDRIRGRYGMDAVKRAAFLSGSIDHMSGGISREKRSVDYSRLVIE